MMNTEEKRMAERFHYTHSVCFTVLGSTMYLPDKESERGKAVDVSQGGFRMHTKSRLLKKGSLILLKIPLCEINIQMPVLTEVRWKREELNGGCQIGLSFIVQ
jgi:hypothetical protein